MISVSQLSKAYGPVLAVDRVSFEVGKGQIVGFLGPNGAGKSTTMRMLTCYLPPTRGGATVAGYDIFHESNRVRQNLGYLPENCPLYGEMRVEEYLDFRGRLRRMDRETRRSRIDFVVDRCRLAEVRRRIVGQLSKGFRQRVGLADALLHNPPVLILDEPTVGLDPTQVRETRQLIKELGDDHTLLLSTHILPEVEAVCDRAIIIAAGRVVAQGTLEQLRADRRMQSRVVVECRGPAREVEAALGRLGGVASVEVAAAAPPAAAAAAKGQQGGYVLATLWPRDGQDVREEAARVVIQHGWQLREVRLERRTLEDFFVQVTAEQARAAAAKKAAAEAKESKESSGGERGAA